MYRHVLIAVMLMLTLTTPRSAPGATVQDDFILYDATTLAEAYDVQLVGNAASIGYTGGRAS